jgi:hypothetical protein
LSARSWLLFLILLVACTPQLGDDDDAAVDDDDTAAADDDDTTVADDDDSTVADDDDTTGDDDDATTPGVCAGVGGVSTLTGVCIRFDAQDGLTSLEGAAAGITIPYTIIVEQDVADVVVLPQDAGSCGQPGASGLIVFEQLTGNGENYCRCDEGLCAGPNQTPSTIPAGETAASFEWTGRNWYGPSDTGNPLGAPFPAGIYTLEASAIGRVGGVDFSVSNTFLITLSE